MTLEQWQRYGSIWSLPASERDRQLAECVAPDVTYADPNMTVQGLGAFSSYMAGFQKAFPGHSFKIRGVRAHHGRSLARWDQLDAQGSVVAPGISMAEASADGRF
jgi:hypothetical protein